MSGAKDRQLLTSLLTDVDIAVAAARKAFEGPWKTVAPGDRGRMLTNLSELFEKHQKTIAAVESLDNGKSFTMAMADVGYALGCLRYYGGWADKIHGKTVDTGADTFNYVKKEPIGVCGRTPSFHFLHIPSIPTQHIRKLCWTVCSMAWLTVS